MSGNTLQLTTAQLNWLSTNYPTVAHYTEGGGDYFSPPSQNSPNAGYSFGPFQFDVNTNRNARDFLTHLTLGGQRVFSSSNIIALRENGGISQSDLTDLSNQLAQALQDPSNLAKYQNLQSVQLQHLESQLQAAINYAANNGQSAIANKILNDPGAQLRLMDYSNQMPGGITHGGLMDQFLAGDSVYMPATKNNLAINPNQSLDAQLQNFYQNTAAGATQTPSRVNNLNQGLESVLGGNDTNNQNGGMPGLQLSHELSNAQQQATTNDPFVLSTNDQAVTTTSLTSGTFDERLRDTLSGYAKLQVSPMVSELAGNDNIGVGLAGTAHNLQQETRLDMLDRVVLLPEEAKLELQDVPAVSEPGSPASVHTEVMAGALAVDVGDDAHNGENATGDGRDNDGYDANGYDANGYDADGFDNDGYDADGYDSSGYDADGFDTDGYDADGYDNDGYDAGGYDADGYDNSGYDNSGYDNSG